MTDSERQEFDRLSRRPELADLRNAKTITGGQVFVIVLAALTLLGGTVLALVQLDWRFAVGTIAAIVAELVIFAALGMR